MTFARAKPAGWSDDVDTITAAQLETLDVNQSRALDGTDGGTYTPAGAVIVNGAGFSSNKILASTLDSTLTCGGSSSGGIVHRVDIATTVDGTAAVTIDTKKDLYIFGTPTGARTITVRITTAPIPTRGQIIRIIRPDTGAFDYTIINETLGTTIQVLGSLTWGACELMFNGVKWLVTNTTNAAGVGTGGKP